MQLAVAALIIANFFTNITQVQIDPFLDLHKSIWSGFEMFYSLVFALELGLNMYSSWFWNFWRSSWNVFDFVVVSIGLIDFLPIESMPDSLNKVRLLRAFRVFRLFKRWKSLRDIIQSLIGALPLVLNSFVILWLFMAMYALFAVELYKDAGREGGDAMAPCRDDFMTSRNMCLGDEYFGTFLRSLYSLFQVLIGDSWSEAITRPLFQLNEDGSMVLFTAIFFMSFIFISAIVLLNVVVAVLTDKLLSVKAPEEAEGDVGPADSFWSQVSNNSDEEPESANNAEDMNEPNPVVSESSLARPETPNFSEVSESAAMPSTDKLSVAALTKAVASLREKAAQERTEFSTSVEDLWEMLGRTQREAADLKTDLDVFFVALEKMYMQECAKARSSRASASPARVGHI